MHGLLCSARAAANRITRISDEARPNENVCAALSERLPSDYLRIRRRSGISERYCLPCGYNNFQNQTAAKNKIGIHNSLYS